MNSVVCMELGVILKSGNRNSRMGIWSGGCDLAGFEGTEDLVTIRG